MAETQIQIFQLLYKCEKCGDLNACPSAIAYGTVYTRLCPQCETGWGRYIRGTEVWASLLEVDWIIRHTIDALDARRAIADQLRYMREISNIALEWLGR